MDPENHDWCKVALRHEKGAIVVEVTLTREIPAGHKVGCGLHWLSQSGEWLKAIQDAESALDGVSVSNTGSFSFDENQICLNRPAAAYWIAPAVWHSEDGKWREGLGTAFVSAEETVRIKASDIVAPSDLLGKKKCLNEIEEQISGCVNAESIREIRDKINLLRSAYDAFDYAPFILTCIGTLKSGKSTLVNIFTKCKNASPTGYGVDTTLRPALIVENKSVSDAGEIDVWMPKSNDGGCIKQNGFERILLQECGLDNAGSVAGEVGMRESPIQLDENNLKKVLCEKAHNNVLSCEPMLVVVRIPRQEESVLRQCDIAVLDTPGLDSAESLWSGDGDRYKWIIDVSDMVLFLQSSVAALNSTAAEIIKKIREKNKAVWLIHNKFEAEPWKRSDILQEKEKEREHKAVELFNEAGFKEVHSMSVNLGKAYGADPVLTVDGELNEDCSRECLRQASDIEELCSKIRVYLQSNKERIRKEHWSRIINDRVTELTAAIANVKSQLTQCKDGLHEQKECLGGKVEHYIQRIREKFSVASNIRIRLSGFSAETIVAQERSSCFPEYGFKPKTVPELNVCLNEALRNLWEKIKGDVRIVNLCVEEDTSSTSIDQYVSELVRKSQVEIDADDTEVVRDIIKSALEKTFSIEKLNECIGEMIDKALKEMECDHQVPIGGAQEKFLKETKVKKVIRFSSFGMRGKVAKQDAWDMCSNWLADNGKFVAQCQKWAETIERKLAGEFQRRLKDSLINELLVQEMAELRDQQFAKWNSEISRIEQQIERLGSAEELMSNLELNK